MGQSASRSNPAPLLQPSMEGNIDEVKRIVGRHIASDSKTELSAFVDQCDAQGNAAVHGAAFAGHHDILKFLVEQCGADVISARNDLGCTPLWLCAGYGHVNILTYILERIESVSNLVLSPQKVILAENNANDTPLLAAASRGHVEICKLLLEAVDNCENCSGGDAVRQTNKTGDTPLAVAVGAGHGGELLDILLEWDAKKGEGGRISEERALNMRSSNGLTPLLVACERNNAPIAIKLIENGALPLRDSNGATPLAVAAFCGCDDVVTALLNIEFGKELVNVQDEAGGCTPLWLAARTGNAKMVRLLLDAGADAAIKNNDGLTAEDAAVKYEKKTVMEIFGYDIQEVKDGEETTNTETDRKQ